MRRAQRAQRVSIHPLPPVGDSPCLRGRKWVIALAVVTNCPPETGWTSEAEGVDGFPFSVHIVPLRSPVARSQR